MSKKVKNCSNVKVCRQGIGDFEKLKVIELCAGLGGTKIGAENTGLFEVVQASEIEPNVIQTYFDNFGHLPIGDFSKRPLKEWESCDVLAASLPCQSFSLEGNRKGTNDERGALIYDYMKILDHEKPSVGFIENVPGMKRLENGKYLKEVADLFEKHGYFPHYTILNSKDFGVPQARERLYICAFSKNIPFKFPEPIKYQPKLSDILEKNVDSRFYLTQKKINHIVKKKKFYQEKGYNFGFDLLNPDFFSRTLMKSDASRFKNLIPIPVGKKINNDFGIIEVFDSYSNSKKFYLRTLTPRECARLQGFPENYNFTSTESQTYQQLGNAVSIPVITAIFREIFLALATGSVIQRTHPNVPLASPEESTLLKKYESRLKEAKNDLEKQMIKNELKIRLSILKSKKSA